MGRLAEVESWEIKTLSGTVQAAMSIMRDGSEVPLAQGQVIVGEEPPAPATWVKPLIAVGGGPESTQFTPLNTQIGPMLARRSYDGWPLTTFASSAAASDVAAGRHSYWSFKPPTPLTFMSSPSQQQTFSNFLDTIPAGHEVTIFVHHEPENNMDDFPDIQAWGALQNMVADIVHSKNRPTLRFGPCFMGPYTFDTTSSYYQWINDWQTVMDWSKFDVIGIDPYATIYPGTRSLQRMLTYNNSGASSTQQNTAMFTFLAQFDIPICIAEWGYYRKQAQGHNNSQPPVDPIPEAEVARWIHESYDWMKVWNQAHPQRMEGGKARGCYIEVASWFNYTLLGSDCPLTGPLTGGSYPLKVAAYGEIVADSKIPPS